MANDTMTMENETFSYARVRAARQLSSTLALKSVVGVIGPNGSGKSTTLRLGHRIAPGPAMEMMAP